MANTLSAVQGKILARAILLGLRSRLVLPAAVNSDFGPETAQFGDTINVEVPGTTSVIDATPSNTLVSPGDNTPTTEPIALNRWRMTTPFHLTDKELREINTREHYVPQKVISSIEGLARDVNSDVFGVYTNSTKGIYSYAGTAGTTPFASDLTAARDARKFLNKEKTPVIGDRFMVLDPDAEANASILPQLSDADRRGDGGMQIASGEIGRALGFRWAMDQQVPTHTRGTISGLTPDVNGALSIGDTTVDIDDTSLTGTLVNGDILSFAGHSDTYTVIGGPYTASGNAFTNVGIYPAIRAAVADNATVTVKDSHVLNLAFHRNAIALASRVLDTGSASDIAGMPMGGVSTTVVDPVSGLAFRLTTQRQHLQTVWFFDVLHGERLIFPELACRIAG